MNAVAIQKTALPKRSCQRVIGMHVYGNLYGIRPEFLVDADALEQLVKESARIGNMHIIEIMKKKFTNLATADYGGVSIIALIEESHIALHTWPENSYATLDIYSCGANSKPKEAFEFFVGALKPKKYKEYYADRGT